MSTPPPNGDTPAASDGQGAATSDGQGPAAEPGGGGEREGGRRGVRRGGAHAGERRSRRSRRALDKPRAGTATLSGRNLTLRFGGLVAVDHVDIDVPPYQVTGLVGANGAGKSSLFSTLTGVQRPDGGQVLLNNRNVTRRSPDARARLGIVQTFQVPSLFPSLTVADNLQVGAESRGRVGVLRGLLGLPEPEAGRARDRVADVLDRLGLSDVADEPASVLPTGALRLVELGRALCADPSVLLLDEPASGLDDEETGRLAGLLADVAAAGVAVLLVDHDVELVFQVADTVYAMAAGTVVAKGTPAEVSQDPTVRSTYLEAVAGVEA